MVIKRCQIERLVCREFLRNAEAEANQVLARSPECALQEGRNYLSSAEFLRDAEVEVLADHYNWGPSLLLIGGVLQHDDVPGEIARDRQGHETTRFVQYPHFDVLLTGYWILDTSSCL